MTSRLCVGVRIRHTQARMMDYCRLLKEIAMNLNWIENGWQRFLDRLKELWASGSILDPAAA